MHRRAASRVKQPAVSNRRLADAAKCLTLCLVAGVSLAACQSNSLRHVRAVTYPPDFHYITSQEIRTTMGRLAVEVAALDDLVGQGEETAPAAREEVIQILTRMRALSGQLKKGAKSNHPRIDDNAFRLGDDIDRALAEARIGAPPSYYYAGRVVGACTYCHAQPLDSR